MADSTTQHRTGTDLDREGQASTADRGGASRTPGLVSLSAGAAGVVVAILPSLGIVALVLAALAIGTGVPAMRKGTGTACFALARTGVVLGMIAVLLGFISLAMQVLS